MDIRTVVIKLVEIDGDGYGERYEPVEDAIYLTRESENYVLIHELIHWSRSYKRSGCIGLDDHEIQRRTGLNEADFDDFEECVAELGSLALTRGLELREVADIHECFEEYLDMLHYSQYITHGDVSMEVIDEYIDMIVDETYKSIKWLLAGRIIFKDNRVSR